MFPTVIILAVVNRHRPDRNLLIFRLLLWSFVLRRHEAVSTVGTLAPDVAVPYIQYQSRRRHPLYHTISNCIGVDRALALMIAAMVIVRPHPIASAIGKTKAEAAAANRYRTTAQTSVWNHRYDERLLAIVDSDHFSASRLHHVDRAVGTSQPGPKHQEIAVLGIDRRYNHHEPCAAQDHHENWRAYTTGSEDGSARCQLVSLERRTCIE